jgi:hypothetical protein
MEKSRQFQAQNTGCIPMMANAGKMPPLLSKTAVSPEIW